MKSLLESLVLSAQDIDTGKKFFVLLIKFHKNCFVFLLDLLEILFNGVDFLVLSFWNVLDPRINFKQEIIFSQFFLIDFLIT